jgi:hypothetical protein
MTGHHDNSSSSIEIDVVFFDVEASIDTCGATPIYLDVDGLPVVTVELFDLDVWAITVERLACWLKAADAATWADHARHARHHGVNADPGLLVWVLDTMAAQMRSLVEAGRR